jgi:hypothetical protein
MIQIRVLLEKEKEGGEGRPQLGGEWKVPMLGGPWKEKEKHLFDLFSLPPNTFYLNLFFSIDFKVLLYHDSRSLHTPFLPFP